MCIKYVVPENIHSSPKDGYWKYQGMQGISNTYHNLFRGKYEAKQEFPEELRGLGSNQKTPLWKGMDIFWNNTMWNKIK